MSYGGLVRRRKHLLFFVAVGIAVVTGASVGLHFLVVTAPLWMIGIVALIPALIVGRIALAMAERWGWMGGVTENPEGGEHDDPARTGPRWISWVGNVVFFNLFFWFGDPWDDRWHRVYPTAPTWMFFAVTVVLAVLAAVLVEAVLAEIVERVRRKRCVVS